MNANMDEFMRIMLAISYWEARKIRGFLSLFFWTHNLACEFKAAMYRDKLRKIKI